MKKFKGRSGQTFRMKNKPISEGYSSGPSIVQILGFAITTYPLHKQAMLKEERSSTRSFYSWGNIPRKNQDNMLQQWTTFSLCPRFFQEQGQ